MAITVLLSDGSRHQINGRNGSIIEWWTKHGAELDRYERLKVEVNCAGTKVVINPQPDMSVRLTSTD